MTMDERLEALTHSVELLAHMQRDNEARLEARFSRIMDALERLADIAANHDRRLDGLEGRP